MEISQVAILEQKLNRTFKTAVCLHCVGLLIFACLFGFEPEDLGSVEASGAIESLCMLWCIRGFRENRWSHAFRLLKH